MKEFWFGFGLWLVFFGFECLRSTLKEWYYVLFVSAFSVIAGVALMWQQRPWS